MTEEDEDRSRTENSSGVALFVQWLFLSTVIAVGLGILGGMLPSRVKLLGIFATLQSLLLAYVVSTLHRSFSLKPLRTIFIAVGVLIVTQSAISCWIAFRDYSSSIEQQQKEDPNALLLDKIVKSAGGDPKVKEVFRKAKDERDAKLRFPAYLQHRVAQLGEWSSPWPGLFAGMEILLAVVLGLFFFRHGIGKTISVSGS